MSATIDILIRIKQIGQEIIKSIGSDLNQLKETVAGVNSAPIEILREEMAQVSENTREAAENLGKIKDVILDVVGEAIEQTRERAMGAVEQTTEHSMKVVEKGMARMAVLIGGSAFLSSFVSIRAVSGVIRGNFTLIAKELFSIWGFGKGIATVFSSRIIRDVSFLYKMSGGLVYKVGYFEGVMGTFLSTFRSLSLTTLLIPLALSQTWFLLKRVTGHASATLTPLQHAQNFIVTIDKALNSSYLTIQAILVPFIGGGLLWAFLGSKGLFMAIPTAINSIISLTMSGMNHIRMSIFRYIGIGRGAFFVLFAEVRKFMLAIQPDMMKFVPIIKLIAKILNDLNPTIQSLLKGKNFDQFLDKFKEWLAFMMGIPKTLWKIRQETSSLFSFKPVAWLVNLTDRFAKKLPTTGQRLPPAIGQAQSDKSLAAASSSTTRELEAGYKKSANALSALIVNISSMIHRGAKLIAASFIAGIPIIKSGAVAWLNLVQSIITDLRSTGNSLVGVLPSAASKINKGTATLNASFNNAMNAVKTGSGSVARTFLTATEELKTASFPIGNVFEITANNIKKGAGKFAEAAKSIDIQGKLASVLDFGEILKRSTGGEERFSVYARQSIENYARALQNQLKAFSAKKSTTTTGTFLAQILGTKEYGKELVSAGEDVSKFVALLIQRARQEATKAAGKKYLLPFATAISESLKAERPEAARAMEDALKAIQGIVLSSIPLMRKAGVNIISELAKGMQGNDDIRKEAQKVAETIGDFYPQSPAKRGPLRNLIRMGFLIGSQLATGMISVKPLIALKAIDWAYAIVSGIASATSKMTNLGQSVILYFSGLFNRIKPYITDIRDTLRESFKIGASPTNTALIEQFKIYGASANEAGMAISKMQKALNAPRSEDAARFESLGINLAHVKKSGDPLIALFSSLSDVIAKSKAGSKEMETALEMLGTSISSNLVLALKSGSDVFRKDFAESMHNTAFLTEELRGKLMRFQGAWALIWMYVRNVIAAALNEVLPSVNEGITGFYEFLKANTARIVGLIIFIIGIVQKSVRLVLAIAKALVTDPKRMIDPLLEIAKNTVLFLYRLVSVASANFLDAFTKTGSAIENIIWKIFYGLYDSFGIIIPALFKYIYSLLVDAALRLWEKMDTTEVSSRLAPLFMDILEWILEWLWAAGERIYIFFSRYFISLLKFLSAKAKELVGQFIAYLAQAIKAKMESNPTFKKVVDYIFGKNFLKSLDDYSNAAVETVDDARKEMKKSIDELTDKAVEVEMKQRKPSVSLVSTEESKKEFAKALSLAKDEMAKTLLSLKDDISIISNESTKALGGLLSEESLSKYQEQVKLFTDSVKASVGQMPEDVQNAFEELTQAASTGTLEEATAKIEALLLKIKEVAKGAKEEAGGFLSSISDFFISIATNLDKVGESTSNFSNMFSELYEMSGKKMKEFFVLFKAMAISETIINTAKGVSSALNAEPIGPWNYVQAASIAAMGTVQVAKIAAEMVGGFLEGGFTGMVPGPSKGKDHKLIAVDGEEFILPSMAVKRLISQYGRDFLNNLQNGLVQSDLSSAISIQPIRVPAFLEGGSVGDLADRTSASAPASNLQIINVVDNSMLTRMLSTRDGKQAIWNVMSDNASFFREALGR